jgi:hypothetical protein
MTAKLINKRGLLIALGLSVFVLVIAVKMIRDIGPNRPTTYSVGERGYKAFYLWLKQMGFETERWTSSLIDLPQESALLFIISPEIPSTKKEVEALKTWVDKGGTLIIMDSPAGEYISSFGLNWSYVSKSKLLPKEEPLIIRPGPLTEEVTNIKALSWFVLFSDQPEVVIPIANENGGLMAVVNKGKGKIIAFSSPNIFSNAFLREKDNARLAYNIVRSSRPRVVWFDEYHHGYGRTVSVGEHFRQSKWLWPFIQLFLAFILFWALKSRRFGSPRPVINEKSRSSMEFISAMANLFKQTENRHYILETILKRIKEESRRYLIQGDADLNQAFNSAETRLKDQELRDHDLLSEVKKLYQSFYRAKHLAPGGQSR